MTDIERRFTEAGVLDWCARCITGAVAKKILTPPPVHGRPYICVQFEVSGFWTEVECEVMDGDYEKAFTKFKSEFAWATWLPGEGSIRILHVVAEVPVPDRLGMKHIMKNLKKENAIV